MRFLRFWEARNVKRGGELMGVDTLFHDSKVSASKTRRFINSELEIVWNFGVTHKHAGILLCEL
ncbi:unnamed protein product [Brassica oleracea]